MEIKNTLFITNQRSSKMKKKDFAWNLILNAWKYYSMQIG